MANRTGIIIKFPGKPRQYHVILKEPNRDSNTRELYGNLPEVSEQSDGIIVELVDFKEYDNVPAVMYKSKKVSVESLRKAWFKEVGSKYFVDSYLMPTNF